MPYEVVNTETARLSANLIKQGRSTHITLKQVFGTMPIGTNIELGIHPVGAKIAPTVAQESKDVKGQDPETGEDMVLASEITSTTVTYDEIAVVTPDDVVRSLHIGAPPTIVADGPLIGTKIYPFAAGASISIALTVIRKRKGSNLVTVYWHPAAALQNAGYADGDAGTENPVFSVSVQAWSGVIDGALLLAYAGVITKYGAIFEVDRAKLTALQEALAAELV